MKLKMTRKLMLVAAVALLSGSMVVYAASTLFTQTFPGQTFTVVTLTAGSCGGSLVLNTGLSTYSAYAGQPAELDYDCGGSAAFSTAGTNLVTATATPTFTLPSGWGLEVQGYGQSCTTPGPLTAPLTSGTPVTLTGGTGYQYCLSNGVAYTFTSFSITWTQ